ncbi:MAG: DUF1540 domain-containing protein [Clostridium sp.]
MTRLECTVASCVHNSEKCCCKQGILVEGVNARESCDTCCGSFEETAEACSKTWATPETRLQVDATLNCLYNDDHQCRAERISILGDGPGLWARLSAAALENGRKRKWRRGFCRRPGTRAPRRFGRVLFLKKYLNKVH